MFGSYYDPVRDMYCTCPRQNSWNRMKYDERHCEIHNPLYPLSMEEKMRTYKVYYKLQPRLKRPLPPATAAASTPMRTGRDLVGSLERTPLSPITPATKKKQEQEKKKKKMKKNGQQGRQEEDPDRFVDAYGNDVSTVYEWGEDGDGGVQYDPRWPGVIPHIHHGILVPPGKRKGHLLEFHIEARNQRFIGEIRKVRPAQETAQPHSETSPKVRSAQKQTSSNIRPAPH